MLAQTGIHIQEDNTFLLQVLKNAMVNHFTLILSAHPGPKLLLSFGNTEAVKGVLNIFRDIIPGTKRFVYAYRRKIVLNITKVDLVEHTPAPPLRHRAFHKVPIAAQ